LLRNCGLHLRRPLECDPGLSDRRDVQPRAGQQIADREDRSKAITDASDSPGHPLDPAADPEDAIYSYLYVLPAIPSSANAPMKNAGRLGAPKLDHARADFTAGPTGFLLTETDRWVRVRDFGSCSLNPAPKTSTGRYPYRAATSTILKTSRQDRCAKLRTVPGRV
jgi:hypothetical protein